MQDPQSDHTFSSQSVNAVLQIPHLQTQNQTISAALGGKQGLKTQMMRQPGMLQASNMVCIWRAEFVTHRLAEYHMSLTFVGGQSFIFICG